MQRRVVMAASMASLCGRLQNEGQVIHVVVDRAIPHGDMLRSVGRMGTPVTFGRSDDATNAGSPDRDAAARLPALIQTHIDWEHRR